MSTLREAAQQALEALETCDAEHPSDGGRQWYDAALVEPAITALKAALAQPEQEPVAWVELLKDAEQIVRSKPLWKKFINGTPLANDIAVWMADFAQRHTHPPRREWRSLTEEDIQHPHPPAKPPVYATAQNTKSVRDGFEMGGYEKEPGYYSEEQLDEFARAIEAALKEKNHE